MSGSLVAGGTAWVNRAQLDVVAARYTALSAQHASQLVGRHAAGGGDPSASGSAATRTTASGPAGAAAGTAGRAAAPAHTPPPNAPVRPPARPGSTFDTYA